MLGKDGNPVPGLTRQDFVVEEDGRPQQVTEFQSVELPPPSTTARPARPVPERRISFNSITAGHIAGRAFVLVFDDINLTRQQASESKKALRRFVESAVTDEDSLSLITTSGGGWFHARTARDRERLLALADKEDGKYIEDTSAERMTDFEAMRITVFQDTTVAARVRRRYANYRVAGMQPTTTPGGVDDMPKIGESRGNVGVVEPYIESRASGVYSQVVARNRMTLGILERALKALEGTRGRKSVILLSKGFIYDPETRGFKNVSRAARRANVAIYFVDARGLVATTSNFTASEGSPIDARDIGATYADIALDAEGAVSVAEDSGGFAVRNTNDLGAGLDRLARESRSYYLLGYVPKDAKADGKFRKISVKVNRPGLSVRARKGYFAPDPADAAAAPPTADLDPEVRRALDSPRDVADLPVRATALVFDRSSTESARVRDCRRCRRAIVPVRAGRRGPVARQHRVRGGRDAPRDRRGLSFRADDGDEPEGRDARSARRDVVFDGARVLAAARGVSGARGDSRPHQRPSGQRHARVRGPAAHRLPRLVAHPDRRPAERSDRADHAEAGAAGPADVPRRVDPLLPVHGVRGVAGPVNREGQGERELGAEAGRRDAGARVADHGADARRPTGRLARIYGISLAGLPPGDYELGLAVRDEIGVKLATLREPFTVDRAVGVTAAPAGVSPP